MRNASPVFRRLGKYVRLFAQIVDDVTRKACKFLAEIDNRSGEDYNVYNPGCGNIG